MYAVCRARLQFLDHQALRAGKVNVGTCGYAKLIAGQKAAGAVIVRVALYENGLEPHFRCPGKSVLQHIFGDVLPLQLRFDRNGGQQQQLIFKPTPDVEAGKHGVSDHRVVFIKGHKLQLREIVLPGADLLHQTPHQLPLSRVGPFCKNVLHQVKGGKQILGLHWLNVP